MHIYDINCFNMTYVNCLLIAEVQVISRVNLFEIYVRQSGVFCQSALVSPVSTMPPMLYTHIHRNTSHMIGTNDLGTFKQSNALSDVILFSKYS